MALKVIEDLNVGVVISERDKEKKDKKKEQEDKEKNKE